MSQQQKQADDEKENDYAGGAERIEKPCAGLPARTTNGVRDTELVGGNADK